MSPTLVLLVAAALMVLAAVEKRQLAWRTGERRCRHCHRERRYCSCPARTRRGSRRRPT